MRYVCIHSHCYQPPRENPWLETIERQDSAYPYHDWNERIMAECYAPNSASRILDPDNRIIRIVNNYSNTSFNFGPTLLSWMESEAPEGYSSVLQADRESRERFSGHGSALAQAYNHLIMPLANSRDKETQIIWGLEDFWHRFARQPEGMWLPETAVDLETLDILAKHGIRFTILSPYQARRIRPLTGGAWTDVTGGKIDPARAYEQKLPSGRSIALFFYDGPVSQAVAFEKLLDSGEKFSARLMSAFSESRGYDQLVHIATDGETYGHHHPYGEMALCYALHHIEQNGLAKITNYGEYLENHPPEWEVEFYERTAWSCVHGVGRWSENCGCNSGGRPGWNQEWRKPLRAALDFLRDLVAPLYEEAAGELLLSPWTARDAYIKVILNRSETARTGFLLEHQARALTAAEQVRLWKLLELQRHAMLMYTSCGWFFDELSGIETVQVILYAARVVQLAEDVFDLPVERPFLEKLAAAHSNLPEHGNGADVYRKFVKPAMVDVLKFTAHYAISSMFEAYPDEADIYCYSVAREDYRLLEAGKLRFMTGKATFTSRITQDTELLTFGALHFGDHNLTGGVRRFQGDKEYRDFVIKAGDAFYRADVPEVIRLLDRGFGADLYSLNSLFRDEQQRILGMIMTSTVEEAEAAYRQLYEHHAPLMRFLHGLNLPLPEVFKNTAEFALNSLANRAFSQGPLDAERIKALLDEARVAGVHLDETTLEFTFRKRVEHVSDEFSYNPRDVETLRRLVDKLELRSILPFQVVLWSVQNKCWGVLQSTWPAMVDRAARRDRQAREWTELFLQLGDLLNIRIEQPVLETVPKS
jgi:alpha-amylase/alpha-mannosidase (GH57 family)